FFLTLVTLEKRSMANLFDLVFGSGGKPFRRDAQLRVTVDADGKPILEAVEGESVTLSPEGSLDRIKVSPDRFYHCGCTATVGIGGKCGEPGCNRISCIKCFGRCLSCSIAFCLV